MESNLFIDINIYTVTALFIVGFIGGMVSGFIGSGGAFVLTPAMMTLGVPGIVAVASNICHKFPKSLVGAMKRRNIAVATGPGHRHLFQQHGGTRGCLSPDRRRRLLPQAVRVGGPDADG